MSLPVQAVHSNIDKSITTHPQGIFCAVRNLYVDESVFAASSDSSGNASDHLHLPDVLSPQLAISHRAESITSYFNLQL
jgi:hypothetical protein